jgi:hypothetical protein
VASNPEASEGDEAWNKERSRAVTSAMKDGSLRARLARDLDWTKERADAALANPVLWRLTGASGEAAADADPPRRAASKAVADSAVELYSQTPMKDDEALDAFVAASYSRWMRPSGASAARMWAPRVAGFLLATALYSLWVWKALYRIYGSINNPFLRHWGPRTGPGGWVEVYLTIWTRVALLAAACCAIAAAVWWFASETVGPRIRRKLALERASSLFAGDLVARASDRGRASPIGRLDSPRSFPSSSCARSRWR